MRAVNNWAIACAVAFAVASAVPAAAQGGQEAGTAGQSGGQSGTSQTGGGTGGGGATAGGAGQMGGTGQTGAGGQMGRENSQSDLQKFVEKAAISNMAEIQLGQLAQQKAQNPEVKQFAQMMVDEHTKAQTELQQAASAAGVAVPSSLDEKHQKINDKLSNLNGADFDRQYVKVMVDAHNDARKLLEKRAGKSNASGSYRGSGLDIGGTAGTGSTTGTSGTSGGGMTGTSGTSGTTSGTTSETEAGSSSTRGVTPSAGSAGDVDSWAAATLPSVEHHLQMAKDLEKRVKDEGKNETKSDKSGKSDK